MGGSFLTLLNQVGSMFVMMLVGYVVYQAKLVNDESVAHLSNVVLYVAAPALTIVSLQEKFDFQLFINAGWAFLLSCVVMGIGAIVSQVVYGSKEPLWVMSEILMLWLPKIDVSWAIMPGWFLCRTHTRARDLHSPIWQAGKFTEFLMLPFSR